MVSKKRSRATTKSSAKKVKTFQDGSKAAHTVPADPETPQSTGQFLEVVTIKEEPLDVSSSPCPKRAKKPISKPNHSVCELCLRKCPLSLLDHFASGTNLAYGLQKVNYALQIDLESRAAFSVCRTCWQLVEIVATFRDSCRRAQDWREREEAACRNVASGTDAWFAARTSKAMEQLLVIVQRNLDYFDNEEEKDSVEIAQDAEGEPDESSFHDDGPDVKYEEEFAAEDDEVDGTERHESEQNKYSTVTEKLEITISDQQEESPIKADKTKLEFSTDLTPLPVFECTKCGRRFDSKNGLGLHVRRTEESPDASCKNSVPLESPYCCTVCTLYFKTKILLKGHMDKHLGTKSLACRKGCGKMFYTGATLRVHEHDCGTDQNKRLCPQCGLHFVTTTHLNRHMTQVHGEANIPCKICGKQFKTREAVLRHMNYSHSTENSLSCSQCDKKYKNPDSLRVHMRLHTNEMPYGCDICGKRFRYSHAVRPHMLREHGAGVDEGEGGGAMEVGEDNGGE